MKRSIKRQLLLWLLVPLLSLSIISTLAAYFLGVGLARNIYDKQLLNSADSVAARIKIKGDLLAVDLPPAARSILRHNNQDDFYFQVISPEGKVISGDKALPPPTDFNFETETSFRTVKLNNREVRIVCQPVTTPDFVFDHVLIQAGETRNTRSELAGQITMSILLAQLLLIVSGGIAIWIGIGRGLLPLAKVEHAVEARSPGDLRPFEVDEPVEIDSLVKALNRLLKQLDADIELQRRFTSNAAHQLRTPLAVLSTYCDLARKLVKEPEALHVLRDLDAGINRMSKLVSGLLVLARTEQYAATDKRGEVVDLNYAASIVTASKVPAAIAENVELEFFSASRTALVYGDQCGIEELLSNLIDNGISYTQSGGYVVVKVEVRGGKTLLVVEDDGPGIPVEERGKVFERFYRIPGTEQPGTGLGLAIVKEIAASHRATVDITKGANGKGTAVTVYFPEPVPHSLVKQTVNEGSAEKQTNWKPLSDKLVRFT
ncbi:MAG: sensor histidine kinase [Candidatus Melainabacteria bacterium]|nr:sensor histidine kinase [Candidatus Melainabacteria bacterium]